MNLRTHWIVAAVAAGAIMLRAAEVTGTTLETGGARTQILRSDDAGKSWRFLTDGLPGASGHMTCGFATDPQDANSLCVAYTDGTIYASGDGGDHWRQLQIAEAKLYGVRLVNAG